MQDVPQAADAGARLEQCYVLSKAEGAAEESFCTKDEVKSAVRLIPKTARDDARVTLVAYPVAKRHNVARRNGKPPQDQVLRKWRISIRGRLVEMAVTED